MTIEEKQELVRLLNLYKQEQLNEMKSNKEKIVAVKKEGKSSWEADITWGLKAQYNHARIIAQKLEKEIEKEIPSYWYI